MKPVNQVFILPQQPKPEDRRPRNAFGFLTDFGKAYREYHDQKEKHDSQKRK